MPRLGPIFSLLAMLALAGSSLAAQDPAGPTSRLAWDQSDTDAPALTYAVTVDGAAPLELAGVTCTLGRDPR